MEAGNCDEGLLTPPAGERILADEEKENNKTAGLWPFASHVWA